MEFSNTHNATSLSITDPKIYSQSLKKQHFLLRCLNLSLVTTVREDRKIIKFQAIPKFEIYFFYPLEDHAQEMNSFSR